MAEHGEHNNGFTALSNELTPPFGRQASRARKASRSLKGARTVPILCRRWIRNWYEIFGSAEDDVKGLIGMKVAGRRQSVTI